MSTLSRSVRGSKVLVTGAASGMGRATAELFAEEGARVAITDRLLEDAEPVAAGLREFGLSAQAWKLDVASAEEIAEVVPQIAGRLGGLDILVNNAGVSGFAAIDGEAYEEVWARSLAVLLSAHQRVVRAALPYLRRSAAARIVNIASTEALAPRPWTAPTPRPRQGWSG